MGKPKRVIEKGALVECSDENGAYVGVVTRYFSGPAYEVHHIQNVYEHCTHDAARVKPLSAEETAEYWKARAKDAEAGPKTVTLTLERDGVINGIMCPAGQYRVTEFPNAPSIISRVEASEAPTQPLIQVPAEDDEPYTAVCSQCEKTEDFPDEADAATDMQKKGWKFVSGDAVCAACSGG